MSDLFLDPKVLDYSGDRYDLILLTLRWARAMKAKGSPEPMAALIERSLRDLVENRVTKEEIMANKVVPIAPVEEVPAVVSVAGEGSDELAKVIAAEAEAEGEKKKTKKKKKKED